MSDALTSQHRKQLIASGLMIAIGVPIVLGAWIAAAHLTDWSLVSICRGAGVCSMLLLATSIFRPLTLAQPREARLRGFVIVWFAMSAGFNLVWELPLVLLKSWIVPLELTRANLPYAIAWWSYTLSDTIYGHVTPFMVTIELTWLVANAMAAWGLLRLGRGDSTRGYLWLGIAGALQSYNAGLYVVANGVMDRYANIPSGSVVAQILYWGFNLMWTGAAAIGSIVAFRLLLQSRDRVALRA
jgi:hypothetical protein